MSILQSTVKTNDVVTLEFGRDKSGVPVYRISWYNGKQWGAAQYASAEEAMATYAMLKKMLK